MVVTAHAATGGFIGRAFNPTNKKEWGMTIIIAVGSHLLLDFIPHWDYPFRFIWIALDLLAAALIIYMLIKLGGC